MGVVAVGVVAGRGCIVAVGVALLLGGLLPERAPPRFHTRFTNSQG